MNLAKTELAIFYACDGGYSSGNLQSIPILFPSIGFVFRVLFLLCWRLLDWWKDAIEQCCGWIGFRFFLYWQKSLKGRRRSLVLTKEVSNSQRDRDP
jgi:hypothetical protein